MAFDLVRKDPGLSVQRLRTVCDVSVQYSICTKRASMLVERYLHAGRFKRQGERLVALHGWPALADVAVLH